MTLDPYPSGAVYGPTPGVARNMQAGPSPLAGGDLNGTSATSILFSHAGTPASFLGLPRNLGGSNLGIPSPVVFVDFAVDYHPPASEIAERPGASDDLLSSEAQELEDRSAAIGESGEAAIAAEPEPEPEPPHHPKHKHKGRRV